MKITDGFKKGYYIWSNKKIINKYFLPLKGQTITKESSMDGWVSFINYVESIYNTFKQSQQDFDIHRSIMFCTEEEYQETVEKYDGTCGKFVWNEDNKCLKLPTVKDLISKSIETYNIEDLKAYLENYNCCYCYPGLTVHNINCYPGDITINRKRYTNHFNTVKEYEEKDVWQELVYGYMYLIIKDVTMTYYLDNDIPNLIMIPVNN